MIIYYCHKCGKKGEFETKKEMKCDCGHYVKKRNNTKDHVNMRTTWSGTTQVEFNETTVEESIRKMNNG
jgi:DNA-directed RNA polymerase subunit RPC12/RpoP|tara:strand:- start:307 stop:513 length:207 start_codon:yes stop_codon:yes gene_type:complete